MQRLIFALFIVLSLAEMNAQKNIIYGNVTFPAVKKTIQISRGTQYRNRLNQVKLEDNAVEEIPAHEQVVIWMRPLGFEPEVKPMRATIIQKNKIFVPNVIAITRGSTVEFLNNDDFYHNVFSLTPKARFNIGRRKPGKSVAQKIEKSGIIKIFCDIHPQMNAVIVSLDTPYFSKLDGKGNYSISNLPDGKYEVNFFHPNFTFPVTEISVKGGIRIMQNFNDLVWQEEGEFHLMDLAMSTCCTKIEGGCCEN